MSLRFDPLVIQIKQNINDEIEKIVQSLANGSAGTFDDYKKHCGKIQGLRYAIVCVDEAIDMYLNDDDDE